MSKLCQHDFRKGRKALSLARVYTVPHAYGVHGVQNESSCVVYGVDASINVNFHVGQEERYKTRRAGMLSMDVWEYVPTNQHGQGGNERVA